MAIPWSRPGSGRGEFCGGSQPGVPFLGAPAASAASPSDCGPPVAAGGEDTAGMSSGEFDRCTENNSFQALIVV